MTRETKVGLLVGMGVILLIGIIVSDHLAVVQHQTPADFTSFAQQAQQSISPMPDPVDEYQRDVRQAREVAAPVRRHPVPTPQELDSREWAPTNEFHDPRNAPESLPMAMSVQQGMAQAHATVEPVAGQVMAMAPQNSMPSTFASADSAAAVPTITLDRFANPQPQAMASNDASQSGTAAGQVVHYVKKGETLYQIAQKYYGNGEQWRVLAQHNTDKLMPNGQVNIGVRLVIPSIRNTVPPDLGPDFVPVTTAQPVRVQVAGSQGGKTIEVVAGDTLSGLASRHLGSSTRWKELLAANSDQLDEPSDLRVGMTLVLPGGAGGSAAAAAVAEAPRSTGGGKTYKVQSGDTLSRIAERVLGDRDRWNDLYQANRDKLKSPDSLVVGQELRLPG